MSHVIFLFPEDTDTERWGPDGRDAADLSATLLLKFASSLPNLQREKRTVQKGVTHPILINLFFTLF